MLTPWCWLSMSVHTKIIMFVCFATNPNIEGGLKMIYVHIYTYNSGHALMGILCQYHQEPLSLIHTHTLSPYPSTSPPEDSWKKSPIVRPVSTCHNRYVWAVSPMHEHAKEKNYCARSLGSSWLQVYCLRRYGKVAQIRRIKVCDPIIGQCLVTCTSPSRPADHPTPSPSRRTEQNCTSSSTLSHLSCHALLVQWCGTVICKTCPLEKTKETDEIKPKVYFTSLYFQPSVYSVSDK